MTHGLIAGGEWLLIAVVLAAALPRAGRGLAVPAGGRPLPGATTTRACAPAFPRHRRADPRLERGTGDRRVDRPADGGRVPAGVAARLRGRRREHRRHPRGGAGEGGAVPGPRRAPAPGARAARGRRTRSTTAWPSSSRDDWMQALLITDADVIFEPAALRTMTRHLADPRVGAVTAYIKEGSRPGNYLTRFIGYEYVTAQAAARRGQNVLGAIACLAGGAQLHSRANLARPRRPDRHHLAGRGHHHHLRDPAARPPGGVRAARRLLGRGTRLRRRPVEAAAPLGARQRAGHPALPRGCGSAAGPRARASAA